MNAQEEFTPMEYHRDFYEPKYKIWINPISPLRDPYKYPWVGPSRLPKRKHWLQVRPTEMNAYAQYREWGNLKEFPDRKAAMRALEENHGTTDYYEFRVVER